MGQSSAGPSTGLGWAGGKGCGARSFVGGRFLGERNSPTPQDDTGAGWLGQRFDRVYLAVDDLLDAFVGDCCAVHLGAHW